jgi:hypothetical protein
MNGDDIGTRFVRALSDRSWSALRDLFHPSVQLRALLPIGLREASGAMETSGHFQSWFGSADAIEPMDCTAEPLLDKVHLAYRLRVHKDRWYRIEQQAFCVVTEDRIQKIDLLCSGFRPEE